MRRSPFLVEMSNVRPDSAVNTTRQRDSIPYRKLFTPGLDTDLTRLARSAVLAALGFGQGRLACHSQELCLGAVSLDSWLIDYPPD